MTYIVGGKIIVPNGIVEGQVLAYTDTIAGIINAEAVPAGSEIIDAKGNYVAPGLVDIHIHGYLNEDASDGKAEGIRKIAEGIIKNGVTSFLPTTMTVSEPELLKAFGTIRSLKRESQTWNGAEILGVHAEGPFINPNKKGAQAAENIQKPNAAFILANSDIIRNVTLAPEMDEGHAVIKETAAKSDILLSMGHTDASYDEACAAVKDGMANATHLFNAMTALAHRNPGVVGAALASDDCYCEIIADTFHINPGLYKIVAKQKCGKLILITDCTRAGGMPDGEYDLGGQSIFLKGIECRLADGTIAGSVLKLNEAVRNVRKHTSLPIYEVAAMASGVPARAVKADSRIGSIEVGKDADIIIADEDFNILKTIKRGKLIYEA